MTRQLFARYLDNYAKREMQYLRRHCQKQLTRFYEQKNHQKRNVKDGGGLAVSSRSA